MILLSEIFIYPVKSLGGIKLNSSEITTRGLKYDRRWMIVDSSNRFVTQRTHPRLSLVDVYLDNNQFIMRDRGDENSSCPLPLKMNSGLSDEVVIWDDKTSAIYADKEASSWISQILKGEYRFVYMPDTDERKAGNNTENLVSFADAYPFLIIGQNSLNDLNSKLDSEIGMIRFRPNFVFSGGEPYEEDEWKEFLIGDIQFSGIKPCARCVIPTINPQTGEKSSEPTRTLAFYRKWNNKIYFGMNLISHSTSGKVSVNDLIRILEKKKAFLETQ